MLPLAGVRIIAVEVYGAGPFGSAHLADLGAVRDHLGRDPLLLAARADQRLAGPVRLGHHVDDAGLGGRHGDPGRPAAGDEGRGLAGGRVPRLAGPVAVLVEERRLVHQHRLPGGDPPRTAPLPAWARAVLALQATVMLVAGVALLCAPAATAGIWPWTLTPLMGRAAASWLIAIGLAAALALWENDWWRIRVPLAGYTVLAILQLVALARYSDTPEWASLQAVVYLAVLASMLVLGVVGYPIARRSGNIQLPGVLSSGNGETIERNAQCEASPSKRSC